MKKVINVTEEDIKQARELLKSKRAMRSRCCPVALAATKVLGKEDVRVGFSGMTFYGGGCDLPKKAQNFITLFDSDAPVKPIRFEVEL